MSELENIARDIVRHEEERQVEKIKLESEIKSLEEVLEHGISTEFVEEEVIYVYSPKTAHEMREKLEENYKQLHAQLTIPKSIADELLNFRKSLSDPDTELLGWLTITTALYRYEHFSENFIDWWAELEGKANNLAIAYLNPLTRDLVKVVEG